MLRLEKIDPARNMHRFYCLDLRPTLFGEWTLWREWGRIGGASWILPRTVPTYEEAHALLSAKAREKRRRGYARLGPDS